MHLRYYITNKGAFKHYVKQEKGGNAGGVGILCHKYKALALHGERGMKGSNLHDVIYVTHDTHSRFRTFL